MAVVQPDHPNWKRPVEERGAGGGTHNGGEPPHNDGMDARIAKLEDFALDSRERMARVETKLDHIEKEVSNFKWWVVAQIVAALLTVIGTGVAIQQMTVASFQAAAQQIQPQAQQPIIINVPPAATR